MANANSTIPATKKKEADTVTVTRIKGSKKQHSNLLFVKKAARTLFAPVPPRTMAEIRGQGQEMVQR